MATLNNCNSNALKAVLRIEVSFYSTTILLQLELDNLSYKLLQNLYTFLIMSICEKKEGCCYSNNSFDYISLYYKLFSYEENTISALQVGEPNPEPRNPFSNTEGAPSISIKYNNNTYVGELRSAAFSYGDVNDILESFGNNSSNITSIIPDKTINISEDEQIQLLIRGNPTPENQPNTLSSTFII